MMYRKPARRVFRGLMWVGAVALVAIFAAMLILPMNRHPLHEADARTAPGADMTGADNETDGRADASVHRARDKGEEEPRQAPGGEGSTARARDQAAGADASRIAAVSGYTVVRLDPETQERSGLKTQVLEPLNFAPEIDAFGRVVDIQPLLALRARYTAAQSQADIARTTLTAAKNEYDRLFDLNKQEGDVATKRIQQAEAEWKKNQAELRGFEVDMASIRDETRQQWGQVLANWALEGSSPDFERLLKHQDVLVLVTLPPAQTLPSGTETIQIFVGGDRAHPAPAALVSPAPTTDPVVQGETYFFRSPAAGLRAGMRPDVTINQTKNAALGVVVPQSAVIWALGQAWAYVRLDAMHFVRRPVSTATEAPGGWFVIDTVKPGDSVVVAGAQMLYAEEFRSQIHNEDNND